MLRFSDFRSAASFGLEVCRPSNTLSATHCGPLAGTTCPKHRHPFFQAGGEVAYTDHDLEFLDWLRSEVQPSLISASKAT
jgi:hypothetical protein